MEHRRQKQRPKTSFPIHSIGMHPNLPQRELPIKQTCSPFSYIIHHEEKEGIFFKKSPKRGKTVYESYDLNTKIVIDQYKYLIKNEEHQKNETGDIISKRLPKKLDFGPSYSHSNANPYIQELTPPFRNSDSKKRVKTLFSGLWQGVGCDLGARSKSILKLRFKSPVKETRETKFRLKHNKSDLMIHPNYPKKCKKQRKFERINENKDISGNDSVINLQINKKAEQNNVREIHIPIIRKETTISNYTDDSFGGISTDTNAAQYGGLALSRYTSTTTKGPERDIRGGVILSPNYNIKTNLQPQRGSNILHSVPHPTSSNTSSHKSIFQLASGTKSKGWSLNKNSKYSASSNNFKLREKSPPDTGVNSSQEHRISVLNLNAISTTMIVKNRSKSQISPVVNLNVFNSEFGNKIDLNIFDNIKNNKELVGEGIGNGNGTYSRCSPPRFIYNPQLFSLLQESRKGGKMEEDSKCSERGSIWEDGKDKGIIQLDLNVPKTKPIKDESINSSEVRQESGAVTVTTFRNSEGEKLQGRYNQNTNININKSKENGNKISRIDLIPFNNNNLPNPTTVLTKPITYDFISAERIRKANQMKLEKVVQAHRNEGEKCSLHVHNIHNIGGVQRSLKGKCSIYSDSWSTSNNINAKRFWDTRHNDNTPNSVGENHRVASMADTNLGRSGGSWNSIPISNNYKFRKLINKQKLVH